MRRVARALRQFLLIAAALLVAVPSSGAQVAAPGRTTLATADSTRTPASARLQLLAALNEAAREPLVRQDTVANAVVAVVRRRTDSLPPEVSSAEDSLGQVVFGYVDLSTDGSYTGELRLRVTPNRNVILGVTTRHCEATCRREADVAVTWRAAAEDTWTIDNVARREAEGEPVVFVLQRNIDTTASPARRVTARVTTVRGVLRDEKGRPLPNIEVFSADGAASTVSNENGEYQLTLNMPPGGMLLTTRRIGWAPTFHTVRAAEGREVTWNPVLNATTVLARELVTATGVPEQLRTFRYNDFVARRARGIGQFFMTEEIWSAMSPGDVLNRANGVRVSFTYGNRVRDIKFPGCDAPQRVGVYLDGINETSSTRSAEEVLSQFVSSAIVAMEVYKTRGEIPGEFARPEYCAVIALWMR